MSIHYIGFYAADTAPTLLEPGEFFGEDAVDNGHVAVTFSSSSDAVAFEGTREEVRELLQRALDSLIDYSNDDDERHPDD